MTDRQRCRGDNHKPNCAHLGLDPKRKYCRGDKHRFACAHLAPGGVSDAGVDLGENGPYLTPSAPLQARDIAGAFRASGRDPRPSCERCGEQYVELIYGKDFASATWLCRPCYRTIRQ